MRKTSRSFDLRALANVESRDLDLVPAGKPERARELDPSCGQKGLERLVPTNTNCFDKVESCI